MRLPADVMRHCVQFMTLPTMRSFADVHPTFECWVVSELHRDYDACLRKFVADPEAFRGLMRLCGAVLSGSFALSFIRRQEPAAHVTGNIAAYVPKGLATRFTAYLVSIEGFSVVDHSPSEAAEVYGTVVVVKKGSLRIEIVPSAEETSLFPLAHYWATHVQNFLSADHYCVAYPELTFRGRSLLAPLQLVDLRYPPEAIITLMQQHERQGFEFRVRPYAWDEDFPRSPCSAGPSCPKMRRFFGDRFCVMGCLSRERGDSGYERQLPSASTAFWWRGGDACGLECAHEELLPERKVPAAGVERTARLPRDV